MQAAQKAALLRRAMELLEEANALQQRAIGADTDISVEYNNRIEALVDDMVIDIIQFDEEAAQ